MWLFGQVVTEQWSLVNRSGWLDFLTETGGSGFWEDRLIWSDVNTVIIQSWHLSTHKHKNDIRNSSPGISVFLCNTFISLYVDVSHILRKIAYDLTINDYDVLLFSDLVKLLTFVKCRYFFRYNVTTFCIQQHLCKAHKYNKPLAVFLETQKRDSCLFSEFVSIAWDRNADAMPVTTVVRDRWYRNSL